MFPPVHQVSPRNEICGLFLCYLKTVRSRLMTYVQGISPDVPTEDLTLCVNPNRLNWTDYTMSEIMEIENANSSEILEKTNEIELIPPEINPPTLEKMEESSRLYQIGRRDHDLYLRDNSSLDVLNQSKFQSSYFEDVRHHFLSFSLVSFVFSDFCKK